MPMKNQSRTVAQNSTAKPLCHNGKLKILAARKPESMATKRDNCSNLSAQKSRDPSVASDLLAVTNKQPPPQIPGLTKPMVRRHLTRLIKQKVLPSKPVTVSDWLLAEWHLAKELQFSPMRLAYFISEATCAAIHSPAMPRYSHRLFNR